jgi:hypothetical protein
MTSIPIIDSKYAAQGTSKIINLLYCLKEQKEIWMYTDEDLQARGPRFPKLMSPKKGGQIGFTKANTLPWSGLSTKKSHFEAKGKNSITEGQR